MRGRCRLRRAQPPDPAPASPKPRSAEGRRPRARALADTFLAAYFDRFPEAATQYGVPGRRHDRLTDNSLEAQKAWEAREDGWLAELKQIDPATIAESPLRATYAIARQTIESDAAKRVCRDELWPVSQMTGWQVTYGYLVTIQPVGTDQARQDALARWGALPKYVDTEIANLGEGVKLGYTAPKQNVRIVIDQVRSLASTPLKDSPFHSPAERDTDPAFKRQFDALVTDRINPAAKRYADYLEKEYLPEAREAIAITANPNGAACYDASVLLSQLVAENGERGARAWRASRTSSSTAEMKAIGERSFGTSDVPKLMQRLRTDPQYRFKSRDEKIAYSQAALARAKAAVPSRFGLLPKADVVIQPYPKFREKNAPERVQPAGRGRQPARGVLHQRLPGGEDRAGWKTSRRRSTKRFPAITCRARSRSSGRRSIRSAATSSTAATSEGWALYAERLADEMKLFSADLDRLGMLSSQALRASRLVVDSGLHTLGWSRQRAIDYMLAHTAESEHDVTSEVDRYIIYPGQATAYMIGMLEIRAARDEAEQAMGAKFDIKAFHDRVLEDGGVPLTFLRGKIRAWIGAAK